MEIIREDFQNDSLVRARNHLENRGFAPYSCQVEDWLKEHDEDLGVWRNARDGKYRIVDKDFNTITEIEHWQLSYGIVNRIKKIDTRRGFNAADEVEKNDDRMQREFERNIDDLSYNFAKDTRKLVSQL